MRQLYFFVLFLTQANILFAATFGTVVSKAGGSAYSDIALDSTRGRIYLVNPASNTIDVYALSQKTLLASISVPGQPVAEAMSRDGNYLYVTAYTSSVLYQINLNTASVAATIAVPYHPQGVGVGVDERVLITTVGPGSGSATNTLFLFDPTSGASTLTPINLTVPPPTAATTSTIGRQTLDYSSALIPTVDGKYIVGVNGVSSTERAIFVYETASATVLRSREVVNLSNVLSIAPDSSKFMAGSTLFDFNTLQVIAQENVANSPFAFPSTNNFNLAQNQGGSTFSPDGSMIYAAFNVNPVTNPASAANVTELLVNDPTNLRILTAYQMPENLAGKIVSTAAGDTIYAISDSGFMILPVGSITQNPLITVDSTDIFLGNDQCGATAGIASGVVNVSNGGSGRLTANVQSYTIPSVTGVTGLGTGGFTGPGGITITLPTGGGGVGIPITGPGGIGGAGGAGGTGPFGGTVGAGTTTTSTTTTTTNTGPNFKLIPNSSGGIALTFSYNPNAAKAGLGTNGESDFLIQAPEAINIAPNIRVFQNNRNAEARGTVFPVAQNISAGEALMDMLYDSNRRRIYLSNAGLNRIEVFDMTQQQFLAPIPVGQLPNNMAFGTDGNTLYVANTGGESISIVDLNQQAVVGSVQFPILPYDSTAAIVTPQAMASTIRGPLVVMSDGTLYEISGTQAIPHTLNPVVFGSTATTISAGTGTSAFRTMASSPEGDYVILFTGTGNAYLYSALIDDFTISKQIFTTLTGLLGPVTAGPNGQYYVVNGTVLNSSLTPVLNGQSGTGASTGTTTTTTSTTRPVSAVTAVNTTSYAVFSEPIRTSSSSTASDAGEIQILNATSGQVIQSANALETSPAVVTGTSRTVTNGRTLVIDSAGGNAYAISVSGLSVIPMTPVPVSLAPALGKTGVVNLANLGTSMAADEMAAVYGTNLATAGSISSGNLPLILGGSCVTLNNVAVPLVMSSAAQINFQIPPGLAAGKYSLVVRSIANHAASGSTNVTVAKYAPAVIMTESGQASIYHSDGSLVTTSNPTTRDQTLTIFAAGLGPTTGGSVVAGAPSPSSPLAVTAPVSVYFGPVGYSQAPVVVNWSGLTPGMVGVYQIDVYVPGTHMEGDAVPVTIKVGGVSSPTTGSNLPTVASN
jgi:uncharacterized protein (TIGR03437 family)